LTDATPSRRAILALAAAQACLAGAPARAAEALKQVPFRRDSGFILVDIQLEGRPAIAIIDNGAAFSLLDIGFARQIGQATRGRRRLNGETTPTATPVKVTLAGQTLAISPALADLRVISGVIGGEVAMVLGYELFAANVVALDFDRSILSLAAPDGFVPPPGAVSWPLTALAGHKVAVRITLGEASPAAAMIDLGFAGEVAISKALAARSGLADRKPQSTAASSMFVGQQPRTLVAGLVTAPLLRLGNTEIRQTPVEILPGDELVFSAYDAVIGAPILTRFNLWLDLTAPRMWARANSHLADPFARDRIGLQGYMDGGQFRVMHVRLGSPANHAGLTTQDRVAAINGQPAAELIEELKYQAPAGRAYTLTLADGRQVSLTATDFY
jgi:hypothetical protein